MLTRRLSYNIIFSSLSKVISIGLALYGIRLLTHYLGTDGFGQYTLALAYFGFMMALSDMGLYTIATREISRDHADEDTIMSKVFTLRLVISGVIASCVITGIWFLPYDTEVQHAILLMVGAFLFSSSYTLFNGVFQKHLAMDRVALAEFIGKCVQVIVIIAVARLELSFLWAVSSVFFAMVSNFFFVFWFLRRFVIIRLQWDTSFVRSFIRASYPMGISAIATFLYFKVDTILLSLLQDNNAVGMYGAAYKIIETLIFFPAMVAGLVLPLFSRFVFTDKSALQETLDTTIRFFALILIPLVISLYFLAPEIIGLISDARFYDSAVILQILSFALIGIFFGHLLTNMAIAANLQRRLMWIFISLAFFNVAANIILIPTYSYFGAAASSVVTEILVALLVYRTLAREADVHIRLRTPLLFLGALLMIAALYMWGPFEGFVQATYIMILYGVYALATGLITRSDLENIRPRAK